MADPFGEILRAALRNKLSVRAFARAAKVSPGYISRVISGDRWPLPRRLREWADILGLEGQERQAFILTAELEAAPEELRNYVQDLRKKTNRNRNAV